MKVFGNLMLALLLIVLTGGNTLPTLSGQTAPPTAITVAAPLAAAAGLTQDECLNRAVQAHRITVQLFSEAFESEFFTGTKKPWAEIRPQLLPYWSAEILDGSLAEFYTAHLGEWGYEMGFAFPLWQPELIEDIQITHQKPDLIAAKIKVPLDYDTVAYFPLTLEKRAGNWVIVSPFLPASTGQLI